MSLTIKNLITILQPLLLKTTLKTIPQKTKIKRFILDSRQAQKGDCFIAMQGEKTDGHIYIKQALQSGAICYIADKFKVEQIHQIISFPNGFITINSLEALKLIAKHNAKNITLSIGITGTAGKTTTKMLIYHLISNIVGQKNTYVSPGGLNGEIGTPLALANLMHPVKYGILEIATAYKGEILDQLNAIKPDIPILLTVGHAHTEFFDDIKGVLEEKASIFTDAHKAVFPKNLEQEILKMNLLKGTYITFGYTKNADLQITDVKLTQKGTQGVIVDNATQQVYSVNIPLYHKHIFENIAAAFGALKYLDLLTPEVVKHINSFKAPAGRGQIQHYKYQNTQITFADYTYNANEISIKNAIDTLNAIDFPGPKIFYLGDVLELGEKEREEHEKFAVWLAKSNIDIIFLQGPRTRHTYKKLQQTTKKVYHAEEQEKLIKTLNRTLNKYSKVFIWSMGSHGMQTWNITNEWQRVDKGGFK